MDEKGEYLRREANLTGEGKSQRGLRLNGEGEGEKGRDHWIPRNSLTHLQFFTIKRPSKTPRVRTEALGVSLTMPNSDIIRNSQPDSISTEEKDHLERSTKKIKSHQSEEDPSGNSRPMEAESNIPQENKMPEIPMDDMNNNTTKGDSHPNTPNLEKHAEKARSFKAALLNAHTKQMDCDNQRSSEFD